MQEPVVADHINWSISFDQALNGYEHLRQANARECAAYQRLFGMKSIHSIEIHVQTKALGATKPRISLSLDVKVDITQMCGVSLEDFRHLSHGQVFVEIMRARDISDEVLEIGAKELNLADLNEPDLITGPDIDLEPYIVEALGLAYDPYARAPGVEFNDIVDEPVPSPFAKLEQLLNKPKT